MTSHETILPLTRDSVLGCGPDNLDSNAIARQTTSGSAPRGRECGQAEGHG